MTIQSTPLADVEEPAVLVEAIRRYCRGGGREKDTGKSQLRGAISFYRKDKPEVAEFLQKVLNSG